MTPFEKGTLLLTGVGIVVGIVVAVVYYFQLVEMKNGNSVTR